MNDQPDNPNRVMSRRKLLATAALAPALATPTWSIGGAVAEDVSPEKVQYSRDVVYGEIDGQQLRLDVVSLPPLPEPRPAVITMHGGALVFGDRSEMSEPVLKPATAGYVAFNIDYRLFSQEDGSNQWPAQLDDAQWAVRWVRANAATHGVDPERVGAFGHSSGGQLVAFLGTRDTRDNTDAGLAGFPSWATRVVDVAGPMDFTIPSADPETNATTIAILGGTADTPRTQPLSATSPRSPLLTRKQFRSCSFVACPITTRPPNIRG